MFRGSFGQLSRQVQQVLQDYLVVLFLKLQRIGTLRHILVKNLRLANFSGQIYLAIAQSEIELEIHVLVLILGLH